MGEFLSLNIKLLVLGTYQIGRFKMFQKFNKNFFYLIWIVKNIWNLFQVVIQSI